jgi:hypothetical protein
MPPHTSEELHSYIHHNYMEGLKYEGEENFDIDEDDMPFDDPGDDDEGVGGDKEEDGDGDNDNEEETYAECYSNSTESNNRLSKQRLSLILSL